jgi:L-ascorbate metabolism protein UlaG (beta-lactamase superfamily)
MLSLHIMKKQWRSFRESANYKGNKFSNLSPTPMLAEDSSYRKILLEALKKPKSVTPPKPLPSVKTDLKSLYSEKPVIIWFGHSSYLVHCKGTNILVDPVFGGYASPVPGMVKAFPGSDAYTVADMPDIDVLVVTHNHYDHLDMRTVPRLRPKAVYEPLGVGKYMPGDNITEMDWWETEKVSPFMTLTATPARHFSGRGLIRGGSLWSSFVLQIHGYTIFLGGDSGYDKHFKTIGDTYGPFDLAILECGQYDKGWPYIHMFPEQTITAAVDLKAKALLPVHWGKFSLSNHPWNEPVNRVTKAAKELLVTTPRIGEQVIVGEHYPQENWWEF